MSEFQKNNITHQARYRSHSYSYDANGFKYVNYLNIKSKNPKIGLATHSETYASYEFELTPSINYCNKNETQKHKSQALSESISIKNLSLALAKCPH